MAVRAGGGGHHLLQLLAHGLGLRLAHAALDVRNDALKRLLQRSAAAAAVVVQRELFAVRAVEDDVHGLL